MPSYKSNVSKVLKDFQKQLEGLPGVVDKASREIAADLVGSNISRIHNEGKAVDGSDIGEYKEGKYKNKRKETGKRIDKVNLSFDGKLSKEFSFDANGDTVGVGFLTDYGGDLHENLEEKYDKKIWGMTQEDERIAQKIAENKINDYLNGKGT